MNLITVENIKKTYSEKVLLNNVSFGINDGDKIGLIGLNGSGKSTLLKIITERDEFFDGSITKGKGVRVEYLSQNSNFDPNATVLEQVFNSDTPEMKLLMEYETLLDKIKNEEFYEQTNNNLIKVQEKIDSLDLWNLESEVKVILTKLGINDYTMKMGTLSGGQKKRVFLASALIKPCELLVLDEPTNHLDSISIEWLEEYLNNRKGALLMITHDRYFLDRVSNKILELDRGNIYTYTGFLGLSELAIYNSMKKELQFAYPSTFGGSESSERQIIRFGSPEIFGYDDSFPISVFKISPLTPKFAQELEHRDYLGAIMNLGIERSLIGDILIKEKDAYVYCMNHIAEFITDNLTTIKHNHVRATVCDKIPDIIRPVLTEFEVIAASARIDAVVASITKLSRSSALEFFSAKKVFLNGMNIENNSAQLKPGDILVIRGFGKFIFDGCGNETRKGRVYVHMRRY